MHGFGVAWLGLGLVLWLLTGVACRSGDHNTGVATGPSGTVSAAPSGSAVIAAYGPCPNRGDYRCSPADARQLQYCDPDTSKGWTDAPNGRCDSAELCDPLRKRCLKCKPGAFNCSGSELQQCDKLGSGLDYFDTCESQDYCSSASGECATCLPGEARCSGNNLSLCENGSWSFKPCAVDTPCSAASKTCRACVEGEYQCSEQIQLMRCDANKKWQPVESCLTERLCKNTAARLTPNAMGMGTVPAASAKCDAPVCDAGAVRCNPELPAQLERCSPQRDMWEVIDTCASGPLCNAVAGHCEEPACGSPGAYRCNGMALQVCSPDGSSWSTMQTCNTADECNVAKLGCQRCQAGDFQCNYNKLQQCDEMGRWQDKETCASAALCQVVPDSATQACKAPLCPVPGAFSCNGPQLVQCSMDQASFLMGPICESATLCNSADQRCNVAACPAPNEATCVGNKLMLCPADQSDLQLVMECPAGQVCDSEGRRCVSDCPNPPLRCNGPIPERCSKTATKFEWEVIGPACGSHALCHATEAGGVCDNAACGGPTLPDFICAEGGKLQRCSDQRTGWEDLGQCPSGTLCDPGAQQPTTLPNQVGGDGPPQCDPCVAGKFSCSNGALQRCSDNGQMQVTVQQCRGADYCSAATDGASGFCFECDAGEKRCNAGNLQRCESRKWVEDQTCDVLNGCHDAPGNADYCNACPAAGAARCDSASSVHTCNPEQTAWIGQVNCGVLGCEPNALGMAQAACRACAPGSTECGSGNTLRSCNTLGAWGTYAACTSGSSCRDSLEADYCTTCTPSTRTCAGEKTYRECPANGIQTDTTKTCPTDKPYCDANSGDCVACKSTDMAQCPGGSPDSSFRRVCEGGKWTDKSCGGSTSVCLGSTGNCVECVPGRSECLGGTADGRRVCDANGKWQTTNCTMSNANVCLAGSCVACSSSAPDRCETDGVRLTECSAAGQWTTTTCSGTTPACVSGACHQCNPNATVKSRCVAGANSAARQICSSAGNWDASNCSGDTPVCFGTTGNCVCKVGDQRCNTSGVREICVAGASGADAFWRGEPCGTGLFCTANASTAGSVSCSACRDNNDCSTASAGLRICQAGACVCAANSEQCIGSGSGQHQVCVNGAWSNSSPCTGDFSVCQASTGACVCESGKKRCSGSVRQTCVNNAWANDAGNPSCAACSTSSQCSNPTPICDGVACAKCNNNCANDRACASDGSCVDCTMTDTSFCTSANKPACSASNTCVQCSSDNKDLCTGNTPACVGGNCAACRNDADCTGNANGSACNTATGACVKCVSDAGCASTPALPVCGPSNTCVACTASKQALCAASMFVCDTMTSSCVKCLSNAQCTDPANSQCNTATHQCSGCTSDTACPGGVCDTGICAACKPSDDSHCPTGTYACTASHQCVECTAADEAYCTQNNKVCDAMTNKCVGCTSDVNCGSGEVCNTANHTCVGCLNDSNCRGNTPACNQTSHTCVECTASTHARCTGTKPACKNNSCSGCTSNPDCAMNSAGSACNTSTGACVACNMDDDCGSSMTGSYCSGHQCVQCVANANCSGTKPICNGSNVCVACSTSDDQCGSKKACQANGSCGGVECSSNTDCSGVAGKPVCSGAHTCVECAGPSDCNSNPNGRVCSSNVCVECTGNTHCASKPGTLVCDMMAQSCVECTQDNQVACMGTTPICSSGNQCVRCTATPQCDSGKLCDTTSGACVACIVDGDCQDTANPTCGPDGVCIPTP